MKSTEELTQGELSEDKYEEEWVAILTTGSKYPLSKAQANFIKDAVASGSRDTIPFESFLIPIPYLVELYRVRRFLKNAKQLPARTTEKPMSKEDRAKARARLEKMRSQLPFLKKHKGGQP